VPRRNGPVRDTIHTSLVHLEYTIHMHGVVSLTNSVLPTLAKPDPTSGGIGCFFSSLIQSLSICMLCTLHTYKGLGFLLDQWHIFSLRPNFVKHSYKTGLVEGRMGPISGFGSSKVFCVSFIGKILTPLNKVYFYRMSFKCFEIIQGFIILFPLFIVFHSFIFHSSNYLIILVACFFVIDIVNLKFCTSNFFISRRTDQIWELLEHTVPYQVAVPGLQNPVWGPGLRVHLAS
jgi:hypothetical protein